MNPILGFPSIQESARFSGAAGSGIRGLSQSGKAYGLLFPLTKGTPNGGGGGGSGWSHLRAHTLVNGVLSGRIPDTSLAPPINRSSTFNMFHIHPSGNYVAYVMNGTPQLFVQKLSWPYFGTRCPQPATGINSSQVRFSPDGKYLAVAIGSSPYIKVYPFTNGVVGTAFSNPATLPTAANSSSFNGLAWSPDGRYIGLSQPLTSGTFINVYQFSSSGFGSLVSQPVGLTSATNIAWSPNGKWVATNGTNSFAIIPWADGFGSFTSALTGFNVTSAATNNTAWTPDSRIVFVANGGLVGSSSNKRQFAAYWSVDSSTGAMTNRRYLLGQQTTDNVTQVYSSVSVSPDGEYVISNYRGGKALANRLLYQRTANGYQTFGTPIITDRGQFSPADPPEWYPKIGVLGN